MAIDRWVIPPAVAAALFAVVAVSPPVDTADLGRPLRVEVVPPSADARALLLRVAAARPDSDAPAPLDDVRAWSAEGGARVRLERAGADAWSTGVVAIPRGGAPARVVVAAAGTEVTLTLARAAAVAADVAYAPEAPVDVAVAGSTLVPEVPGEVLVRAVDARAVRVVPAMAELAVTPSEATPGACGVAAFRATLSGLGAPVTVEAEREGALTTRVQRRLAVSPGGVSLSRAGQRVTVRGAFGGAVVWIAGGDEGGARWWRAVALASSDEGGVATVEAPDEVRWVLASMSPRFDDPGDAWLRWDRPAPPCATDDASRRWFEVQRPSPPVPAVALAHDGAARLRRVVASRTARARSLALAALGVSVALEAALVLGLGLRRGPSDEEAVAWRARRERVGFLVAGVAALLVLGLALALASQVGALLR